MRAPRAPKALRATPPSWRWGAAGFWLGLHGLIVVVVWWWAFLRLFCWGFWPEFLSCPSFCLLCLNWVSIFLGVRGGHSVDLLLGSQARVVLDLCWCPVVSLIPIPVFAGDAVLKAADPGGFVPRARCAAYLRALLNGCGSIQRWKKQTRKPTKPTKP